MKIPKRFIERVNQRLKTYQSVALSHRSRDVSEADTVTVVKDMLSDVFGYDKYSELTSEYQIKGTFCDLAIRVNGKTRILVEVKAAALKLNENHLRQAVGYGAQHGVEWVALTNSIEWRIYRIKKEPIVDAELVADFSIETVKVKSEDDLQKLYLIAKEGMSEDAISSFHATAQLLNKFTVAQVLMSEPTIRLVRNELRKLFPEIKIDPASISDLLVNEVLKRETIEGEKVKEAQNRMKKAAQKLARTQAKQKAIGTLGPADVTDQ